MRKSPCSAIYGWITEHSVSRLTTIFLLYFIVKQSGNVMVCSQACGPATLGLSLSLNRHVLIGSRDITFPSIPREDAYSLMPIL